MCAKLDPDTKSILFNIVGGTIVALLTHYYSRFRTFLKAFSFKRIFGRGPINETKLVYGKMMLLPCYDENRKIRHNPYSKKGTKSIFRVESILADTEAISIKYLSDAFSKNVKESPLMVSDDSILDKIDISYLAFGGLNNLKSIEVLDSNENEFYKFGYNENGKCDRIVCIPDKQKFFSISEKIDYALIIKIRPKQFPSRFHFCIAGIGEAGTRGASYFLGNKWNKILKKTKGKEFGMIIKVTDRKDESAEIIDYLVKDYHRWNKYKLLSFPLLKNVRNKKRDLLSL